MSKQNEITRPQNQPIYFGALDGFRGLFAILVAIHHTTWFSYLNYGTFIDQAYVIIDLFFAFSGFLLYTLYHKRLNTRDNCIKFMKRRFARLYPLHLFTLFGFTLYAIARLIANKVGVVEITANEILPFQSGATESWPGLLSNLTLTHSMGVHDQLTFNAPSWTISVEFFTYFLFMGMMLWAAPKKAWHFALIGLGCLGIYYGLSQLPPKDGFTRKMDITYDFGFFRCVAGFFIGVVAARVYAAVKANELLPKTMGVKTWTGVELLMMTIGGIFLVYFQGPLQFYVGPVIFLFMLVFSFDGGLVSRFMSHKIFQYLAKISYSVYMVHFLISIVFNIVGTRLFPEHIVVPQLLDFGADGSGLWGDMFMVPYLATVLIVSHLTYHFVEVPGGRFLQKFSFRKALGKKIGTA